MSQELATASHIIPKVVAYVTRRTDKAYDLLVFRHAGQPDAGVQVPAGGMYPAEGVTAAVERELVEETGLTAADVVCVGQIGDYTFYNAHNQQWQRRHVFWLEALRKLPDNWDHVVTGRGEDAGLIFQFEWIPVATADELLAGGLGDQLQALRRAIESTGNSSVSCGKS